MSTQDQLRQALAGLPAPEGAVHLELAGLRFIDVICARELMTLTVRHPNFRLILHSPPVMLIHMISLLWPGSTVEICTCSDLGGPTTAPVTRSRELTPSSTPTGHYASRLRKHPDRAPSRHGRSPVKRWDVVAGRAPTRPSARQ
jgi:hypothetical protein